jgi:peptidyl-prolyl cis-trans isomerase D
MLKVLRENFKSLSWILWAIVALFVLAIFYDFGGIGGQRGGGDNVAATVGRETISRLEFQRALVNVQENYRQAYGEKFTPEMEKQMHLPLMVLNQLIQGRLLSGEAQRMGLAVSDGEVRQKILSVFKDEQGHFVGEAVYAQYLQSQHTTVDAYEREVRDELLRQKLVQVLHAGLYVSNQEVEQSYRDQVERAKIRFVQMARGTAAPPVPTQAELTAYYEAHKDEWKLPEQREIAYVLVENRLLQEKSQPDEKTVRAYYDSHQDEFKQEEQVRARQILVAVNDQRDDAAAKARVEQAKKRIDGGEELGKVAAELSDDATTKDKGGDMGFFGRNKNVKEFEDAAFAAPVGKLTGPVRSPLGYHLFQVLEKRPGGVKPFEDVRAQITTQLAAERAHTAGEERIKEVADRIDRAKPKTADDLRTVAKDLPDTSFATTPRFGQNDWVPGIGRQPEVGTTVFAMKKGEVSKPVQIPRGWAVLFLKDIYPPHTQPEADVEARLRQELITQKMQQAALDRLNQAKQELAQGKTLDQVAAELGTKVEPSDEFGSNGFVQGLGYTPQVAKAALALAPGQVGGPLPAGQGAVLFQVVEKKGFDPKQFADQRDQIRQQLENDRLNRLLSSILEERRRELGVTPDRQLLQSYGLGGDESQNQPAG